MPEDGAFETFCDELEALVDRWREKPMDDKLTRAQVVGAMEFVQHKILSEADEEDNYV